MWENILAVAGLIFFIGGGSFVCWLFTRESRAYRDEEKKTRYVVLKEDDR